MKKIREEENNLLDFSELLDTQVGTGLCYVVNTKHSFTKNSKPFFTLYLRDVNGSVIPGYVFDVDNYVLEGINLSLVKGKVVQIRYQENYLDGVGMTVILDKVGVAENIPMEILSKFTGIYEEFDSEYNALTEFFSTELGSKISFAKPALSRSCVDYSGGKIGGLIQHYTNLVAAIKSYKTFMTDEEYKRLVGTTMIFIYTHMTVQANESMDVNLLDAMSSRLKTVASQIGLGGGYLETLHYFFGYTPKDFYVRTVVSTFENIHKMSKELSVYRTLPLTREGNAGYGTIRRYPL